jgi:predicted HicB family RNase H-like nuclease
MIKADVVTFEGESVSELKQAFRDSIDDYLSFRAERVESPEKSPSGKL